MLIPGLGSLVFGLSSGGRDRKRRRLVDEYTAYFGHDINRLPVPMNELVNMHPAQLKYLIAQLKPSPR